MIEESLLGWKEFEMEVVRDRADNRIIVCSIENLDPMGVHTGDSITVAPAQTLTDKEYQIMRNASIAVLREIGVDTGGSNVQFSINPVDGRMIVIEMNPRVSRSSALASKATGFPIAQVAAKLAVGYTLDELQNDITGGATPAMRKGGFLVGGESSGHLLFPDVSPTGDGLLSALKILGFLERKREALYRARAVMKRYPQKLMNLRVRHKPAWETVPPLAAAVREMEKFLGKQGRILLRYSGTENLVRLLVEADQEDKIRKVQEKLVPILSEHLGE